MNNYLKLFLCAVFAGLLFLTGCASGSPAPKETPEPATQEETGGTNPNLEHVSVLDGKIDLLLPKDFDVMSEEMASKKWRAERRPTFVYSNERGNVLVSFVVANADPSNIQASQMLEQLESVYEQTYPSAEWLDKGIEEIDGRSIGYIEMITPANDTDVYNLIWFTNADGETVSCAFNCAVKHMDEWQPIAHEIKNSFRVN